MSRSRTFEWFGRFRNGRTSTANEDRSGRPRTATNPSKLEQVRATVNQDRRRTIHDLCVEVRIVYGSCRRILTEQLNIHRIVAKFVPRVLIQDRKNSGVAVCQEMKETVINDPTLLLNVSTGEESIVYAYDPETKFKSSKWYSPGSTRPKKARMPKSKLKTIQICFFDQEGMVHREFVPPCMRVHAYFYCDVLRRFREIVRARGHRNAKPGPHFRPRQCPVSQALWCFAVFGEEQHDSDPPSPILTNLSPCDFSSSPSWSVGWRVEVLTQLKRFKRNRIGYLTQFQKGTSRYASKHGRNAWTVVFVQNGSTLKEIEEFNIQGKQTSFYKYCPLTFGYIFVYSQESKTCSLWRLKVLTDCHTVLNNTLDLLWSMYIKGLNTLRRYHSVCCTVTGSLVVV